MANEIQINVESTETRIAYLEDGRLVELKIEKRTAPTLVGSIFMGKVLRVLPGMQACFVDIGLERAAFLYVGDVTPFTDEDIDPDGVKAQLPPIETLIKEGQMILVQVMKDPLGTKGARITTHVSLPGRYLVYMPNQTHIGVSRRIISDEQREKLKNLIESLEPRGGVIVRTASEEADFTDIENDLNYLRNLWREIESISKGRTVVGTVFSEIGIEQRVLRDMLSDKIDRVVFDDQDSFLSALQFVTQTMPHFADKIQHYKGTKPIFDLYDIELEIARAMDRKVWLKSGGYIVIDEAEALVVVDVNTGRYTGKKDLEETIFKTNIEAAREIAHQLRIRNLGGIIIIDFIDMEKAVHREMVVQTLMQEVASDRERTQVNPMSELGLVEMTRKRSRPSLSKTQCEACEYCDGRGFVKRYSTLATQILRDLRRELSFGVKPQGVSVKCHPDLRNWILEYESEAFLQLESLLGKTITIRGDATQHREMFEISIN